MAICLVTGGAGFVGSHLVDALLERRDTVRCLVRSTTDLRWLRGKPVELVGGNLLEPDSLPAALEGSETVYHVAGVTKALRPEDFHRGNALATRHLLEACGRMRRTPRRVLVVSSLAAVGPNPDRHPLTEEAPCRPASVYGKSKWEQEKVTREFQDRLAITIVRPPAVYGPRDVDLFEPFRAVWLGWVVPLVSPASVMSLVHVRDLAEGIIRAATAHEARERAESARGQIYFLSAPEAVSQSDFVLRIARALGRHPRVGRIPPVLVRWLAAANQQISLWRGKPHVFNPDKIRMALQPRWVCSAEKAERELGFRARIDLDSGLRETAEWYRSQGWL